MVINFKIIKGSIETDETATHKILTKYQLWNHGKSYDVVKSNEVIMKIFGLILTKPVNL